MRTEIKVSLSSEEVTKILEEYALKMFPGKKAIVELKSYGSAEIEIIENQPEEKKECV
jgi:hypothetical protein